MPRLFRLWRLSARDLGALWRALKHPNRPRWLIPASIALAFFALDPLNFAIPFLGIIDDFVLLPLLLRMLVTLAAPHTGISATARSQDDRVVSVQ
jgi:uncharacterized membrane protein YkvA (DUF1232 family)